MKPISTGSILAVALSIFSTTAHAAATAPLAPIEPFAAVTLAAQPAPSVSSAPDSLTILVVPALGREKMDAVLRRHAGPNGRLLLVVKESALRPELIGTALRMAGVMASRRTTDGGLMTSMRFFEGRYPVLPMTDERRREVAALVERLRIAPGRREPNFGLGRAVEVALQ